MQKTILITGSTDGIGLETAKWMLSEGHRVLIHGRNASKFEAVGKELSGLSKHGPVQGFVADLSTAQGVESLAQGVLDSGLKLDALINNAGVFSTRQAITQEGLDVRFMVNTVAPYLLTRRLLPLLGSEGRVVNLSSAAQSPVDLRALAGEVQLTDGPAYAQSKLALTMWSKAMATELGGAGPAIIAVNPGSMLGTKMVKDAYGVAGADIGIGADVLQRAALSDEFGGASGRYFDNDSGQFANPHPDALDLQKCAGVEAGVISILERLGAAI
ncbi:MAG: SDR family NAD(P)-dependent oxidoreductase [Planctomycetota bacterium]|nr:SDR family NAD(P)-dependent oxidoreductase [Planctomycetota bacterium]